MESWKWSPDSALGISADCSKLWQGVEQLPRCTINGLSTAAVRSSQQVHVVQPSGLVCIN